MIIETKAQHIELNYSLDIDDKSTNDEKFTQNTAQRQIFLVNLKAVKSHGR